MKRALILEMTGPVGIGIIRNLVARGLIEPIYWSGYDDVGRAVATEFKSAIFHDIRKAIRGIPPVELATLPIEPVDQPRLQQFAEAERLVANMMDRMDPDRRSFLHHERERHFRRLLQFWLAAIRQLRPDVAIFPISPHSIYDYVCYAACRQFDIPTMMFDRTAVPEHILCVEDIDHGSAALKQLYHRRLAEPTEAFIPLKSETEQWLARWRGTYDHGMPANFQQKLQRNRMQGRKQPVHEPGLIGTLYWELRRTVRHALQSRGSAPPNYLKQSGRSPEASWLSLFGWTITAVRAVLYKRALRRLYRSLESEPPSDGPYIFVALHYQPERNSNPVGGCFADQLLMVEMVARNLPAGWTAVVKEHSQQLHPYSKGERARDATFYRDIASLPNVRLAPVEISSFDLIDAAAGVATISGSAGWEALCRGKATLVFGAAWYQHCRGAFRIRSNADCRSALQFIAEGAKAVDQDIRLFLSCLEEVACKGIIDPTLEKRVSLDDETITTNIANALAERL